jgi:hypothetical protein
MPIQEPCPIRELKIAIEPLTVEEISEGKWELLKTPIGPMSPENFSGVSMYQRRVGKSMPLSRMKGGSGEGICINDDVLSLDPSRSDDYVLNNP